MGKHYTKSALARLAGVTRMAMTKVCAPGGRFADAMTPAGLVDTGHPLVLEWLRGHGVSEVPDLDAAPTSRAPAAPPRKSVTPPPDPTPRHAQHADADLDKLTVREVVMRYGSIDGFKRYVETLKQIADFQHRDLRVREHRGELVERTKVAGVVFPLLDAAFARLVSDVPDALSKMIVARVESGGPETLYDVQQLIRDANSRVLRNAKQSFDKLEFLKDAN